jgi:aminoglycoside 2''-phosphotransferase
MRDRYEELGEGAREHVLPSLGAAARADCATLFEQFLGDAGNFAYRAVVIHSDLGGRHVLMDGTPRAVGIIDYGSACIGDPAGDFRPALFDFGEEFTRELLADYGHDDPDRAVRNAYFCRVAGAIGGWLEGVREGAEWKIDNKRDALRHALTAYTERPGA